MTVPPRDRRLDRQPAAGVPTPQALIETIAGNRLTESERETLQRTLQMWADDNPELGLVARVEAWIDLTYAFLDDHAR